MHWLKMITSLEIPNSSVWIIPGNKHMFKAHNKGHQFLPYIIGTLDIFSPAGIRLTLIMNCGHRIFYRHSHQIHYSNKKKQKFIEKNCNWKKWLLKIPHELFYIRERLFLLVVKCCRYKARGTDQRLRAGDDKFILLQH